MKAEIFYYGEKQRATAVRLKELLSVHVYPDLMPTISDVAASEDGADKIAWKYVKLLQAAIPPRRDIRLNLRKVPILRRVTINTGYVTSRSVARVLQESFFPALAMHERMVLVPKGSVRLIETKAHITTPLNPLYMGVAEVDFEDESALSEALRRVGQVLNEEVLRDLRAYAAYRHFDRDELAQVAKDLDIDVGFLRHLYDSVAIERALYEGITCELDHTEIQLGRWSKLTLTVRNNSQVGIANVMLKVEGPVKILPLRISVSIPPNRAQQVSLSIMSKEAGEFPLEFVFVLPKDEIFKDWLPVQHIWLHCE